VKLAEPYHLARRNKWFYWIACSPIDIVI
jgi:hypothetical protein